ncbi:MAG: MarR family winged helix-turn-helix transcriptional regulator [Trueperaceae bacterium]
MKSPKTPAPNLSSGMMCASANLRRANRVVSRFYDAVLKPSGLRGTQFTMLKIVLARGPVAVNQLASTLVMDRTTLARDLKPLEKQGFVKVVIDNADQRVRLVMITGKGKASLERAQPLWQNAQQHMVNVFGEERLMNLIYELKEVVASTAKSITKT